MSKHTPGPWYAYDHLIGAGTDGRIAICVAPLDGGQDPSNANARLIAAAPDMLEALEHLIDSVEATGMRDGIVIRDIIAARAAIAKAEGKP